MDYVRSYHILCFWWCYVCDPHCSTLGWVCARTAKLRKTKQGAAQQWRLRNWEPQQQLVENKCVLSLWFLKQSNAYACSKALKDPISPNISNNQIKFHFQSSLITNRQVYFQWLSSNIPRASLNFRALDQMYIKFKKWRGKYSIADVTGVLFIVSHELGSTLDISIVDIIVEESVDGYHHRHLHFVRHHCPYHCLHFS
jgi:hypothetical protein